MMMIVYAVLWLWILLGVAAGTFQIVQLAKTGLIPKTMQIAAIFVFAFVWLGLCVWTIHLIRL